MRWLCLVAFVGCTEQEQPGTLTSELATVDAREVVEPARLLPLPDGRAAFAVQNEGLKILDLSDPTRPRVESTLAIPPATLDLYRVGDHVLYASAATRGYSGDNPDLDLPRGAPAKLALIDVCDPAHPAIASELALDSPVSSGVLQCAADACTLFASHSSYPWSRLARYAVHDGQVEAVAALDFDELIGDVVVDGDWLAVPLWRSNSEELQVASFDIAGSALQSHRRASLSGRYGSAKLHLQEGRLQALHAESGTDPRVFVDTFDLRSAIPDATGRCTQRDVLVGYYDTPSLGEALLSGGELFFNSSRPQLQRVQLTASGACGEQRAYAAPVRRYALRSPQPQRLLALALQELSLYDTSSSAPLARIPLETPYNSSLLRQPIQLTTLATPAVAPDGTPEPSLVSLLYFGQDPIGHFQLATLSDHTLTPRGTIDDDNVPELLTRIGGTLVTFAHTTLRTFDANQLDSPAELGRLALSEPFYREFQLADYDVGTRRTNWGSAPRGRESVYAPNVLYTFARGADTPVASLAVERQGELLQVGNTLVDFQYSLLSFEEERARTGFQVYDYTDPTRPRRAGRLRTDEITGWVSGNERYPDVSFHRRAVIGQALVFMLPQERTSFDVVDFSDPDSPTLLPRLVLPAGPAGLRRANTYQAGSLLYASEYADGTSYGTRIDFSNPRAPVVGARHVLPGYVLHTQGDAVYTARTTTNGVELSRVTWSDAEELQPLAATRLPRARRLQQVLLDDRGYMFVLHARDENAGSSPNPRDRWYRLAIFDAETLLEHATIELDAYNWPTMRSADGEVLIRLSGIEARVDMSDRDHPRLR